MDEKKLLILELAAAITAVFDDTNWKELSYLTDSDEYVSGHSRLLRSLHWGDSDYRGHVIDYIAMLVEKDFGNFSRVAEFAPVKEWLEANRNDVYLRIRALSAATAVPVIRPLNASGICRQALLEVETLLSSHGPASAFDRMHTSIHAFFRAVCKEANLPAREDASANVLLNLVIHQHPAFNDLGPRTEDVKKLIRSSGAIVDVFGTFRNNHSLAHPNEELIGHDEALLAINVAKSLLHYFDMKITVWVEAERVGGESEPEPDFPF